MSECPRCHDREGHRFAIADAHCAYRVATTEHVKEIGGKQHGLAAADLLAHLRSVMSDPQAYATTRYVWDLGWRPSAGLSGAVG